MSSASLPTSDQRWRNQVDGLLADLKRLGRYPAMAGDTSPARTFARFGAADWDARRTAFRDPLVVDAPQPAASK